MIYRSGERGSDLFSIRSGMVKLVQDSGWRGQRILRLVGRGAAIGLEVLNGEAFATTAIAIRESNLCRIPHTVLQDLGQHNPRLSAGLVAKWREHVVNADALVASAHGGNLEQRAKDLLRVYVNMSGDPHDAVRLLKNDDMANVLGVSAESVSRCVARLKRAGVIRRVGPWTYDCSRILAG